MKKIFFYLLTFLPLSVSAQGEQVVRGDCTPPPQSEAGLTKAINYGLPSVFDGWDREKTFKQMVVLIEFVDSTFRRENPHDDYDQMFNGSSYNEGVGAGCVAEYFREQSGGLVNLQFDVYGPYRVSSKAQPYDKPSSSTRNYGREQMMEATRMMLAEHPDIDYTQYDWDGDGQVNQVIYVAASMCGNAGAGSYGFIWPNTSSFTSINTPDGVIISSYSISNELWLNMMSCGIGTICHEYSHSLGLPDIYPTSSSAGFSVVDEWDLMDGGNFTNYGWCPPNYTPMEKMYLGWLEPIDLTEPTTITDLKPVSEGGEIYRIKHTANEYYLLENRQQTGWDRGVPGKGLVVYHVNYSKSAWSSNAVNNNRTKRGFDLVHADNLDYDAWDAIIGNKYPWAGASRLHNRHLSTSPYPLVNDLAEVVNNELTDSSVPEAKMNNKNTAGSLLLSKPITNIRMSEDGLVSFDFIGGDPNHHGDDKIIPGDINSNGEVDDEDVDAFVELYLDDEVPEAGSEEFKNFDANGDGEITLADAVAIFYMSNGLNFDGTDPNAATVRHGLTRSHASSRGETEDRATSEIKKL